MINRRLKTSLVLLGLFIAFWAVFTLVQGLRQKGLEAGDFPQVKENGVFRVCGEESPFSFYNGQEGFHYRLARAFAKRHDLKLVYLTGNNLHAQLQLLKTGKCDVITGPIPVVSSLRQELDYTHSWYESRLILVQRKDGQVVREHIDLKQRRVAVADNQPVLERIHNLSAEISDTIHCRVLAGFDSGRLMDLVASGSEDLAVCDSRVAHSYALKYPNLDLETPVGFSQFQAWAVRPGRKAMLDSLNAFIDETKKSPAFARLWDQYSE